MKRALAIMIMLLTVSVARAQDTYFDSKGVQIHYIEQGTGEPIVLVHGQGGGVQNWIDTGVFQNLARDHRVIALDVRGHGTSGKPHDQAQYGTEMAQDIVRLLDHLGIEQAHIVGFSMGAQLTGLLLTLHPEQFLTATLGGGTGRFQWSPRDEQIAQQEATEYERFGFSPTLQHEIAPANSPPLTEEEISGLSKAALANPNQDRFALAALTRSRHEQAITSAQVRAIKVPTLGVVGELDPALIQFKDLKKLRPELKLVVISGATHFGDRGALARPEFVAAVRDFISSNQRTHSHSRAAEPVTH